MSLPAIDCLQRGLSNVRANWELVLVHLGRGILVTLLSIAGLLPPLMVVGLESSRFLLAIEQQTPDALAASLEQWFDRVMEVGPAVLLSLIATFLIWLLAFLVHCYFQGGVIAVLVAGDRQAPQRGRPAWECFRTFSMQNVMGWGGLYLWRFFWFLNWVLVWWSLLLLATVLLLALAAWAFTTWGGTAAFGVGCGGALPLLFLWVAFGAWAALAQADLAREDSGVFRASRVALRVLGKRLGGVALLFLLYVVVIMAVATIFVTLSTAMEIALSSAGVARNIVSLLIGLAQGLVMTIVGVAFAASLVALVRSEVARPASAAP